MKCFRFAVVLVSFFVSAICSAHEVEVLKLAPAALSDDVCRQSGYEFGDFTVLLGMTSPHPDQLIFRILCNPAGPYPDALELLVRQTEGDGESDHGTMALDLSIDYFGVESRATGIVKFGSAHNEPGKRAMFFSNFQRTFDEFSYTTAHGMPLFLISGRRFTSSDNVCEMAGYKFVDFKIMIDTNTHQRTYDVQCADVKEGGNESLLLSLRQIAGDTIRGTLNLTMKIADSAGRTSRVGGTVKFQPEAEGTKFFHAKAKPCDIVRTLLDSRHGQPGIAAKTCIAKFVKLTFSNIERNYDEFSITTDGPMKIDAIVGEK